MVTMKSTKRLRDNMKTARAVAALDDHPGEKAETRG